MGNDLISIIVPVYNVEFYLERCLTSIFNQTYPNIEVILVNDGSTDNSAEICNQIKNNHPQKVMVIDKPNGGLGSARNMGLKNINGDFIFFVDSDDWLEPDALEYLYHILKSSNADFAMGENSRENNSRDNRGGELLLNQYEFLNYFFKINNQKNVQYSWGKLYKKVLFEDISFPENIVAEDIITTFRIIMKSKRIVYSNKLVYHYSVNDNGITGSSFNKKNFDLLKVWDMVIECAKEYHDEKILINAYVNRYRANLGIMYNVIQEKNFRECYSQFYPEIQDCVKEIRKHYIVLINFKMPFTRKIALTLFCINYKFFGNIINKIINVKKFL